MERIWLKVGTLRLLSLHRGIEEKGDRHAWCSLRLGDAVTLNGLYVYPGPHHMVFSDATAGFKFIDTPFWHMKRINFLNAIVYKALQEKHTADITAFIERKTDQAEFPAWEPESWKGLSLRIPIDFIWVYDIDNPVVAKIPVFPDIMFGRHIVLLRARIFDGQNFVVDPRIHDERLAGMVKKILGLKSLRKLALDLAKERISHVPQDIGFAIKVKGAGFQGKPPAVRFY